MINAERQEQQEIEKAYKCLECGKIKDPLYDYCTICNINKLAIIKNIEKEAPDLHKKSDRYKNLYHMHWVKQSMDKIKEIHDATGLMPQPKSLARAMFGRYNVDHPEVKFARRIAAIFRHSCLHGLIDKIQATTLLELADYEQNEKLEDFCEKSLAMNYTELRAYIRSKKQIKGALWTQIKSVT